MEFNNLFVSVSVILMAENSDSRTELAQCSGQFINVSQV